MFTVLLNLSSLLCLLHFSRLYAMLGRLLAGMVIAMLLFAGCFAVAGDDLRHYPFCPVVEGFIRSEGDIDVCLWFRNRSLGNFRLLHFVNFEAMVISSLWADIIFQVVFCNWEENRFSVLQVQGCIF